MIKLKSLHSILSLAALCILTSCSKTDIRPQSLNNPVPDGSELPYLFVDGSDEMYMSWIEHINDSSVALNYSSFDGEKWSNTRTIREGTSWFVNWADFPSIIADDGRASAAHWLDKIPGNAYSYNVSISLADQEGNWSQPFNPHFDSTATEHGFVSMIPWEGDQILAVWLDGRQTAGRTDEEYYDLDKAMTLRAAVISHEGKVIQKYLIDDSVCDCCQTSLVKTPEGALVAYRDRTSEEIRDISVSRFVNGRWSEPHTVFEDDWKISACPVNGPSLAATDSLTAVSWFTGAEGNSQVKAAFSKDYGRTFTKPLILNDNNALGRVDAAIHGSNIYVSWMENGDQNTALKVAKIDDAGNHLDSITVDTVDGSRRSGFPRMVWFQNRLIFAWTDITTEPTTIKTAELSDW